MATRVLLVDDDEHVRRAFARILINGGCDVSEVGDAEHALLLLDKEAHDVVVSDIMMPGMSGVDLLKALRERDAQLPVILVTGTPDLDSAIMAVNLGAYRYLMKPVASAELLSTVTRAGSLRTLARLERSALAAMEAEQEEASRLSATFERACASLWMAFQPIVIPREKRTLGFEALLRTGEAALARPDHFVAAGTRLRRGFELGRAVRAYVAQSAPSFPEGALVFVNILPSDLADPELVSEQAPLAHMAERVVLEVTERDSLGDVIDLPNRLERLRALGYRIAVDDLGAGYSGLTSLTQLDPQIVKLDMTLVRGIASGEPRQAIVRSMTQLCASMGMQLIAEGVETRAEESALREAGVEIMQGYLFGRPQREIVVPTF